MTMNHVKSGKTVPAKQSASHALGEPEYKIEVRSATGVMAYHACGDDRILYAGLQNGIGLPYECATGTCGSCRATLVSGSVRDEWPQAPGRRHLKGDDDVLMCQCTPRSDCVLDVGGAQEMAANTCIPIHAKGMITRSRYLTSDVIELEVEIDRPMTFAAGQFVAVGVSGIAGYRGYSMVDFVQPATSLKFVVKRQSGGALSEWLFNSKPERTGLDIIGPLGSATFSPDIENNILCIAGGSGIAGIMSILSRAVQTDFTSKHKIYMFFGVRTAEDAFYLNELTEFKESAPADLHVNVALSEGEVPDSLRQDYPLLEFASGRATDVARRLMEGCFSNLHAYLAGPPAAVDASIKMLLLEAKVPGQNIHYDKFS